MATTQKACCFRPEPYGPAAVTPVAWQGRVLTLSWLTIVSATLQAMFFIRAQAEQVRMFWPVCTVTAIFSTIVFMIICYHTPADGWRWRQGETYRMKDVTPAEERPGAS
ncbi:hypothetical protein [Acetobacter thailandicus]|uniref:hypothetical protein n=1 Tax=Acetobacter thailandicus TaxID=1502842 RepID=UPI001BA60FF6|nr:hypothetical protein [Acetobacter thailandicus]MBS0981432.1 hypothetical protein [Acetobacter thailandicus]